MSSVVLGSVPLPASCWRGLIVKPRGCEQEVGMGCEVLTQTPIAGPGAWDCELCRRGRELLALSWPSYKPEVHIGPAATLPAPAWQPSEPQSWSAPAVAAHCALTTRDSTLTTWPFLRITMHFSVHFVDHITARSISILLLSLFTWSASALARTRLNGPTVLPPTNRCYAQSAPGTAAARCCCTLP